MRKKSHHRELKGDGETLVQYKAAIIYN